MTDLHIPDGMSPEQILSSYGLHFEQPRTVDVPDFDDPDTGEHIDMSWATILEIDVRNIPNPDSTSPDTHTTTLLTSKSVLDREGHRQYYIRTLKHESATYILRLLERA